jgi:hypothetical protein
MKKLIQRWVLLVLLGLLINKTTEMDSTISIIMAGMAGIACSPLFSIKDE